MKLTKLESFPPGRNPFHYDFYHMGTSMGSNLMIMHRNHSHEKAEYLILINTETGERWRVDIDPEPETREFQEHLDDIADYEIENT